MTADGQPSLGLHIRRSPGGADPALRDLWWRFGEWFELFSHHGTSVCPDGDWTLMTDRVTRKVWEGYHRRVVLETELKPGAGWRTYMELPGGTLQYPTLYRDVYLADSGELKRRVCVEVRPASEPEGVPRFPRHHAFQAGELFMSEYAMDSADRVDALEKNGFQPEPGDMDE